MNRIAAKHGCLAWMVALVVTAPAVGQAPVPVASRHFDIDYNLQSQGDPETQVELWYSTDDGQTWHSYGLDPDGRPPIPFDAPSEGSYAFFIVAINSAGVSSGPPSRGTTPHLRAFVDFTPPVVQLHPPRQATALGSQVVQLRWTAIDAHFSARPIELEYRFEGSTSWAMVADGPLTNTGRYDWRLPDDVRGTVSFRLTATDLGGHRIQSEIVTLVVSSFPVPAPTADSSMAAPTAQVAERAQRLLEEGLLLKKQGDLRRGIARVRQAVRLDPSYTQAFLELAEMLYGIGEMDRSLDAFGIVLEREPVNRTALRGTARVYRRRNQYEDAAEYLQRILRANPNDAEVWMNLGDIAIFQGDELLARQWYTRAGEVDRSAVDIVAQARKRLELMDEVGRIRN